LPCSHDRTPSRTPLVTSRGFLCVKALGRIAAAKVPSARQRKAKAKKRPLAARDAPRSIA
jgi:hypothetical protein